MQVFRSFEVLGRQTGIPKGLKQKWKIPEERGGLAILEFGGQGAVSILEFPRAREVKILMPPVVGYGYFLESPNNK